jgi:hypothetical protein
LKHVTQRSSYEVEDTVEEFAAGEEDDDRGRSLKLVTRHHMKSDISSKIRRRNGFIWKMLYSCKANSYVKPCMKMKNDDAIMFKMIPCSQKPPPATRSFASHHHHRPPQQQQREDQRQGEAGHYAALATKTNSSVPVYQIYNFEAKIHHRDEARPRAVAQNSNTQRVEARPRAVEQKSKNHRHDATHSAR